MKEKELINKYQDCLSRMREMADLCEKEKRDLTDAERQEYAMLKRDAEIAKMKMDSAACPVVQSRQTLEGADAVLREAYKNKTDVNIKFTRSIQDSSALANTGIIPIQEQELLEPLRAGLIWDKLGIPVMTGLAGTLRWPIHGKVTATWEGESTQVGDSNIDWRALTMVGQRLAVAAPLTKTELKESNGIVERVVRQELPAAANDAINAAMLTMKKETVVNGSKVNKTVYGPFAMTVKSEGGNDTLVSEVGIVTITANYAKIRKELLDMKAAVYGAGIERKNPAFIMNENTKTILEDTKVDAGSGKFVCEEDKIFGIPVLTSNEVPDGVIFFGDWSYQAAGFFGDFDLTVDPYTLARQNSTDFVLNLKFGTATLRTAAFVVGMTAAAQTALINDIKAIGS